MPSASASHTAYQCPTRHALLLTHPYSFCCASLECVPCASVGEMMPSTPLWWTGNRTWTTSGSAGLKQSVKDANFYARSFETCSKLT